MTQLQTNSRHPRSLSAITTKIEQLFVELAKEGRRQLRIQYSRKRPKDKKARKKLTPVKLPRGNRTLLLRREIGLLVAEFVVPGRPRQEVYRKNLYGVLAEALGGLYSSTSLRAFESYARLPVSIIKQHAAASLPWRDAVKATYKTSRKSKGRKK